MDIDSNYPYLLPVFGETTSHLTSKLNVTDGGGSTFVNVENNIKREIRKNCFSKKKIQNPPTPRNYFFAPIFYLFFYVGNSMKRESFEKIHLCVFELQCEN